MIGSEDSVFRKDGPFGTQTTRRTIMLCSQVRSSTAMDSLSGGFSMVAILNLSTSIRKNIPKGRLSSSRGLHGVGNHRYMHRGTGNWCLVRFAKRRASGGLVKGSLFAVYRFYFQRSYVGLICDVGRLHVVLLQNPPQLGEISLSTLPQPSGEGCEIYCSGEYALVLKGLKLLVADIRHVAAAKVLRIIHLNEHTVS